MGEEELQRIDTLRREIKIRLSPYERRGKGVNMCSEVGSWFLQGKRA